MITLETRKKGAKISAHLSHKKSVDNYNNKPVRCLYCNKPILAKENQKIKDIKKKKFCNRSCSASYNNKNNPKRKSKNTVNLTTCEICGTPVLLKKITLNSYRPKKRCDTCSSVRKKTLGRPRYNGRVLPNIDNLSKKEIFSKHKTWQSARSIILRHAYILFFTSTKPKECFICKYKKNVQVCHKKSVASFSQDSLVSEINNLDNLLALCPNHHWEYDNNSLDTPLV